MVLVIGGTASGKRTFVRRLGLRDADVFDCATGVLSSDAEDGDGSSGEDGDAAAAFGDALAHRAASGGADARQAASEEARARLAACAGVVHLEEALRPDGKLAGVEPDAIAAMLSDKQVVACCEMGSGVVPACAQTRAWREKVGRVCCALATRSDVVVRMVCGIPQVLKGSLDGLACDGGSGSLAGGRACAAAGGEEPVRPAFGSVAG